MWCEVVKCKAVSAWHTHTFSPFNRLGSLLGTDLLLTRFPDALYITLLYSISFQLSWLLKCDVEYFVWNWWRPEKIVVPSNWTRSLNSFDILHNFQLSTHVLLRRLQASIHQFSWFVCSFRSLQSTKIRTQFIDSLGSGKRVSRVNVVPWLCDILSDYTEATQPRTFMPPLQHCMLVSSAVLSSVLLELKSPPGCFSELARTHPFVAASSQTNHNHRPDIRQTPISQRALGTSWAVSEFVHGYQVGVGADRKVSTLSDEAS